jgi:putative membrane protein
MTWHWVDGGMWGVGIGMLTWAVVLALIIGLVVWLVTRSNAGGQRRSDPAEETLRHRFATGEIDADEYERRLALLRK